MSLNTDCVVSLFKITNKGYKNMIYKLRVGANIETCPFRQGRKNHERIQTELVVFRPYRIFHSLCSKFPYPAVYACHFLRISQNATFRKKMGISYIGKGVLLTRRTFCLINMIKNTKFQIALIFLQLARFNGTINILCIKMRF